jgi:putative ABC transport system permease protein
MAVLTTAFPHRRIGDMVPLAWRNLTADPKRLARSAAGIGFATLLMLMQLGFYNAFIDSSLILLRMLDADIVLTSKTKYTVNFADTFSTRRLQQALAVPGVRSTAPLYITDDRQWKNRRDGTVRPIQAIGFDLDRPVFLSDEINAAREALKQPGTALIDRRSRRFLGPRDSGLETELARRNIRIIGNFTVGPDFAADGRLIMSDRNFLAYFPPPGEGAPRLTRAEIGVVKVMPGADIARVLAGLRAELPNDVSILSKDAFIAQERAFELEINPVGPIFGLGIFIGFVVGILIAYQVMYTDLSDQLPQYATLKAMGYGRRPLIRTVLAQAVLLALAGYIPSLLVGFAFYGLVSLVTLLPMDLSPGVIALSLSLTVGMCLVSGMLAVRRVLTADPAELF